MIGNATSFTVLKLVRDQLVAGGDPKGLASVMDANPSFAFLGAIGPSIGDFLTPPFPSAAPFPEDHKTVWRRIFHVVGRKDLPGLYYVLRDLRAMLDKVQVVADAEDCDALIDLRDAGIEDQINTVSTQFATSIAAVQAEAIEIAGLISGLKPAIVTDTAADPVPPQQDWAPRDFLHWRSTGKLATAFFNTAELHNDDRLRAYALGYLVSYATLVCGSGHVNSITGAPPRTLWWRQRLVANYVDAWVHGFYSQSPRPTMSLDTPTPAYDSPSWPNLCGSNLQTLIEIGTLDAEDLMDAAARGQNMPSVIPDDFADHWFDAVQASFGALPPGITAQAFNEAYLFTWLVLWFRTSGQVLGCNEVPPLAPPDGCDDAPSELDPFVNGVPIDGNIPQPPAATIDADVDLAAVICGIILAILGGIAILAGNVALGGAAIGGAIALLDCDSATDIEWKQIRCLLFWERMYLHNALVGVHRLLALSALDYPYARELAIDSDFQDLFPFLEPWESGKNLVKSKIPKDYPGQAWDGSLLQFNRPPTQFESPSTRAFDDIAYPDFTIDSAPVPILDGGVAKPVPVAVWSDGGTYKGQDERPMRFGEAVANAIDLLDRIGDELPDWNLDADRGMASFNWRLTGGYDPMNVKIEPSS